MTPSPPTYSTTFISTLMAYGSNASSRRPHHHPDSLSAVVTDLPEHCALLSPNAIMNRGHNARVVVATAEVGRCGVVGTLGGGGYRKEDSWHFPSKTLRPRSGWHRRAPSTPSPTNRRDLMQFRQNPCHGRRIFRHPARTAELPPHRITASLRSPLTHDDESRTPPMRRNAPALLESSPPTKRFVDDDPTHRRPDGGAGRRQLAIRAER